MLRGAHETAVEITDVLAHDHEVLDGIDKGLDEIESELSASRKLITVLVKRLYTDKVSSCARTMALPVYPALI